MQQTLISAQLGKMGPILTIYTLDPVLHVIHQ